jgi:hypothetical protein
LAFNRFKELPMPVDTTKVEGRRKLDYKSLEEVLADAERLSSGPPVKTLGNWSAGQIYKHLADSFNSSIDGSTMTFPWYFRLMATAFKKMLLRGPMPPGFKAPTDGANNSVVPGPTSTEEGLAELRAAVERLGRDPRRVKSPLLGSLSNEEWNRLHLNHANLHMSFLVPQPAPAAVPA